MYTSLTGLNAAQTDLSVISNNVANVGTVGYKRSRAQFGDIIATSPLQHPARVYGSCAGLKAVGDLVDADTGEIVVEAGKKITARQARQLGEKGLKAIKATDTDKPFYFAPESPWQNLDKGKRITGFMAGMNQTHTPTPGSSIPTSRSATS